MTPVRRASLVVVSVLLVSVVALWAQVGGAAQQTPPAPAVQNPNAAPAEAGTGAISGVVIDGATKTPLAGAVVYLGPPQHGPPGVPVRQLTDAKGRFVFRDLPAFGGYFLQAAKFGYFTGYYGRGSTGGSLGGRIALLDGQWFSEANVTMFRPAALSGRVVDQAGEPVVGVYVRVLARILIAGQAQLAAGTVTATDDRGMYRIGGLSPGQYLLQVPSVQSSFPASSVADVDATRAAADSGRPVASRDPVMDVDGSNRLQLGRYLTPLAPVNGRTAAYPPTFYPAATTVADATVVDLKNGDDRTGLDLQLRPVPSFRVSGTVQGPDDTLANLTLRLMPPGAEELGDGSEAATTLVGKGGVFTFLNVPAGAYVLDARRTVTQYEYRGVLYQSLTLPRPPVPGSMGSSMSSSGVFAAPSGTSMSTHGSEGTNAFSARVPVVVEGRDVQDVSVTLRRGVTMTGRIVWEEGESPAANALGVVHVRLLPAGGQASLGQPSSPFRLPNQGPPTDEFKVEGLMAGEYVMAATAGGRVKSVTWKGRDYTHRPFDASTGEDFTDVVVTLTSKGIVLAGTVRDERGVPSVDSAVIVFPAEREQWSNYGFQPDRIKVIQVTNAGGYRFQSLPAGDYYAIAVDPDLIDGWKDPAFLEKASRAGTRISLGWGDNKTLDLKVAGIK